MSGAEQQPKVGSSISAAQKRYLVSTVQGPQLRISRHQEQPAVGERERPIRS